VKTQLLKFGDEHFPVIDPTTLATLYFRKIYRRVHELKFNYLGMITGKHRVGKSLTGVSLAHALDPTFEENLETRVVYYKEGFMSALSEIKDKNIIGGAIIWDEAGLGIASRDWYSNANKTLSKCIQIFGRYRPIVFFITPDMSYIDSQVRKLYHGFFDVSRFDNLYSTMKPLGVSYDKRTGKIFFTYSRICLMNDDAPGGRLVLNKIRMKRPTKELESRYEHHSKQLKDNVFESMKEDINLFESKQKKKVHSVSEVVDDIVTNHVDDEAYLTTRSTPDKKVFDINAIRLYYEVTASSATMIKKLAENQANKRDDEPDDED